MTLNAIQPERMMRRLKELGSIGRDADGQLSRLAASDADKAGRDKLVAWLEEVGLEVAVDKIGNIFGIWTPENTNGKQAIMIGSHIDSPRNAGILDGCYGVLAGLEVIQSLKEAGATIDRPIVVAAFSNEEGVRYAPDMMGSLVYAGGLDLDTALGTKGIDGTLLGEELARIGYLGKEKPGFIVPHAYIELHIEQGPILERTGTDIGVVENLQGISWQNVTIKGQANHAGTTPMSMRRDAGFAAARTINHIVEVARRNETSVATIGTMALKPNSINVVPAEATFSVDLRDPSETKLQALEESLDRYLDDLSKNDGLTIDKERLVRFEPVEFDANLADAIDKAAQGRNLSTRRMTSGAGHDAQMMARICPSAMIFVQSKDGISHNPKEHTPEQDLINGANVLLDVIKGLAAATV